MNLFFVVFCLIVLLPNSRSKLIHNRCKLTCKGSYYSYTAAYVCANEHLGHCFYVLVCYSLLFSSEIIPIQLFASGSVTSSWGLFNNVHLAFGEELLNIFQNDVNNTNAQGKHH